MKRGLPKHGLTRLLTGLSLALLLVASTVGANVTAEEPGDQPSQQVVDAASVSFVLHYQGQLLNPATGAPKPNGDYSMIFKIYNAPTGGTALWTESKNVSVTDGLFSTLLGDTTALDPAVFTGQDLWLGVTVGSDPEATPRQRIAYSAYAMHALNADTVDGQHAAAFAAASHNHDSAYVNDDAGEVGNPDVPNGALAPEKITGTAWTSANMGAGSGLDADTLDGNDSSAFAAASHNHDSAYVNDDAGEVGNPDVPNGALAPEKITGTAWTSANMGAGSGLDADTLDGNDSSAFAAASHNHDSAYVNASGPDSMSGSSAGPILTVEQTGSGPAIQSVGSINADSLQYNNARTHYLTIPAEAFHPGSNVNYFNTYGMGGAYISATGGNALVAPVHLPDGATVTKMTVYFNDSSTSDMTVYFHRLSYIGGGYFNLATVTSSGTAGYYTKTDTTISYATIDNTDGGYLIYAYSTAWDSNLKLMGVTITYTISEAP